MPNRAYSLASYASFGFDRQEALNEWRDGRDRMIREAYASGMTYQAIGEAVGLTKERIRQICDLREGEK